MAVKYKMYPAIRNFELRSIGRWLLPVGRPTTTSKQTWVQQCNFVFRVVKVVSSTDDHDMLAVDAGTGWIIEICTQTGEKIECYVSCEIATSNAALRRRLMSSATGLICRLTSDDFLLFVDEDLRKGSVTTLKIVRHCGKVYIKDRAVWIFPSVCLSTNGQILKQPPGFLAVEFLRRRENGELMTLPSKLPAPTKGLTHATHHLTHLSQRMREYFGPRFVHVVHLFTSLLKAIHFDVLLRHEHSVSITNLSGPPNIGKTFACAILLSMMDAPDMILSRCTPSAMIDAAHVCKNCLIVWDDPRDCTVGQLSSIVHEAFHGHATSTVSRGVRRYHSALVVGTQEHLLGMPLSSVNVATFSRLTHIDMRCADEFTPTNQAETYLQQCMPKNAGLFAHILEHSKYDKARVDREYQHLSDRHPTVIGRALRIAAIDRYLCAHWRDLGVDVGLDELDDYFEDVYLPFLETHCSKVTPLDQFIADIKTLLGDGFKFPSTCFKERVVVDLKQHGPTDCFAVYTKDLFVVLQRCFPLTYTKEQVHAQLKTSPKYGEVSRNVSYKSDGGVTIRRSIVIRRSCLLDGT